MDRVFFRVLIVFFVLSMAATAWASPPDQADSVMKHLEFLGCKVKMDGETIHATHPKRLNMLIKNYRGGMLITSVFGLKDYGKRHLDGLHSLLNKLNRKAAAARYYVDKDNEYMILEAYFPGKYNKAAFGVLLDSLDLERGNLGSVSSDVALYLN